MGAADVARRWIGSDLFMDPRPVGTSRQSWKGPERRLLMSLQASLLRGVVLAGGKGTRLLPMTRIVNKHLLPVYDRPMIYYPLASLQSAGVRDVCVVVGGREPVEVEELLGDGRELGFARLTYAIQPSEDGIAAALSFARPSVGDAPMCVILGDNILEESLAPFARRFLTSSTEAMVLLAAVGD